jgi:hypothetical protein
VLHLLQSAVHESQPYDRGCGIFSLLSEALDFLLLSLDARFYLPNTLIGSHTSRAAQIFLHSEIFLHSGCAGMNAK